MSKSKEIYKFSDPDKVQKKADRLGYGKIYLSKAKDKKYSIINPDGKIVNFGQIGYEDFTKHNDMKRRKSYLQRTSNIKGNWKLNDYSPNNLSRKLLW